MVWDFLKKMFGSKDEESDYTSEEVPQEEINAVLKNKEVKKNVEAVKAPKEEPRMTKDTGFTRYICGKCFKWSEFKKGSTPSSCPHCHCSDKTKFKPQRNQ